HPPSRDCAARTPPPHPPPAGGGGKGGGVSALRQWRIIARIDRMRQILLLRPIPELADVLVGLDGLVPDLEPVFGALSADLADVEVADDVAEMVELERPARRVGETDRSQRRHEFLFVIGVAG